MRLWRDREVSYPKVRIADRSPVICQLYVIRIMGLNVGKRKTFENFLCFSIDRCRQPSGISEIRAPSAAMASARSACSCG